MSDKLHLNDLVDGLPVVMADGRQATVTVNRNKIVFAIGVGFVRPVIGKDGYVTNATRLPSPKLSVTDHDGVAIRASDIQAASQINGRILRLTADKPWPVDPAAPLTAPGVPPGHAASEDEALAYEGLKAMQRLAHKTATDAGWYVDPATGKLANRNAEGGKKY